MKFALFPKKDVTLIVLMLLWLAVIITVVTITLSTTVSSSVRKLPVYSVETDNKEIALTFNCAWGDEGTDRLLGILEEENIKCTFFFVGDFAEKYPDTVRKIYNMGHTVGNHSMKHNDPAKQEYEDILSDISACNELLYSITGKMPVLYRAPSGSYDNKTVEAAESLGMTAVQWDCDSIDWKDPSPEKIVNRITEKASNGSIVLFHLGKENTLEAIDDVIEVLREKGYSFTTVEELLLEGDTYVDNTGRQRRAVKEQKENLTVFREAD